MTDSARRAGMNSRRRMRRRWIFHPDGCDSAAGKHARLDWSSGTAALGVRRGSGSGRGHRSREDARPSTRRFVSAQPHPRLHGPAFRALDALATKQRLTDIGRLDAMRAADRARDRLRSFAPGRCLKRSARPCWRWPSLGPVSWPERLTDDDALRLLLQRARHRRRPLLC